MLIDLKVFLGILIIFVFENNKKMKQPQTFTLSELKQLLDGHDEHLTNSYISQNLAVARNVVPMAVASHLSKGPFVMPEMRVLVIKEGGTDVLINLERKKLEGGMLVYLAENSIVNFQKIQPITSGFGISLSHDLFSLALGNHIPKAFDGHVRDFQLRLKQSDMDMLDRIHRLLYDNTARGEQSAQVTLHLISCFLCYVDHLWSQVEAVDQIGKSREQRLFSDFLQLVSAYAAKEHNIDFYAQRLFLSPRYMSTMVKKVSGRSAKEWIDDALITRIKVALKYTDKQAAQISDEFNFPNTSFFSKFFKRLTGLTPMQYRQS
jgi:AraC-like DNA-binding protein